MAKSTKEEKQKATELVILPGGPLPDMAYDELYSLIFSDKRDSADIHEPVDFAYVHNELNRVGVTLKLLWKE